MFSNSIQDNAMSHGFLDSEKRSASLDVWRVVAEGRNVQLNHCKNVKTYKTLVFVMACRLKYKYSGSKTLRKENPWQLNPCPANTYIYATRCLCNMQRLTARPVLFTQHFEFPHSFLPKI